MPAAIQSKERATGQEAPPLRRRRPLPDDQTTASLRTIPASRLSGACRCSLEITPSCGRVSSHRYHTRRAPSARGPSQMSAACRRQLCYLSISVHHHRPADRPATKPSQPAGLATADRTLRRRGQGRRRGRGRFGRLERRRWRRNQAPESRPACLGARERANTHKNRARAALAAGGHVRRQLAGGTRYVSRVALLNLKSAIMLIGPVRECARPAPTVSCVLCACRSRSKGTRRALCRVLVRRFCCFGTPGRPNGARRPQRGRSVDTHAPLDGRPHIDGPQTTQTDKQTHIHARARVQKLDRARQRFIVTSWPSATSVSRPPTRRTYALPTNSRTARERERDKHTRKPPEATTPIQAPDRRLQDLW
jgi:hypothetical protein